MSPIFLNPTARTQMLTPGVIAVLVTGFLIAVSGSIVSILPLNTGDSAWRFVAASQVLAAAPHFGFLLMMLALAAVYGGEFRTVRWTGIISLLIGVVVVVLVPFFTLDFLVVRKSAPQDQLGRLTREGLRLAATSIVMGIVMIWAGRRAMTAGLVDPEQEKEVGHGLIVAQEDPPQ